MAPRMPDVRSLVPRTPPEGLLEWAERTQRDRLARYGLVYEAEYVNGNDPFLVLDEWPRTKRVKAVRVRCSCCGEETLLNWGKNGQHGYGFVHPNDIEGDWEHTVTAAGDESTCPVCGEQVLVNKASAVGRSYYVTAEVSVMSASLVRESNMLVLTCWNIQRRVNRLGYGSLEITPAEAYVFSAEGCAKLMGWKNAYSGNGGYHIVYCREWRQPERWHESWGRTEAVFGLTPELIEGSCLPNCKLDVYMKPGPGVAHYPVAYLRLYQDHPNVEHVLIHGLPRVLHDLIARQTQDHRWAENRQGRMVLPLDWDESRPAQMLRMTKEELRMAQKRDWGLLFWKLFVSAKEQGEVLTEADIENAFCLGDDNVAELAGQGPVAKSIRYLLRQCEALAWPGDGEDPEPDALPDVRTLLDYWAMSRQLRRDLDDPQVRFPRDLLTAHDRASVLVDQLTARQADEVLARQFRIRRRLLQKYCFRGDGLLIRPAASERELREEGRALHHCVGSYARKHASGQSAIFFIRRASKPREPWFTLELDEARLEVRQDRGLRNCDPPEEVLAFVEKWLGWLRVGCPRWEKRKEDVA